MPDILEYSNRVSPVTATALVCLNSQTLLFAGEGPFLRVFDHTTGKVLIETRVFTSQAIHGIVIGSASKLCGSNNVCAIFVWGGRYIRAAQVVYSREHSLDCNHIRIDFTGPQIGCSGWILDAALHIDTVTDIRPPSLILAVFVTAHNDLLVCEIRHEQEAPKNILLRKLVAGPRSILYSAHVVWLSGTQVLVAAGTVFGEVLLWSLHLRGEDLGSSRCAGHLHRIYTGHEGSIFGVQISQEIQPRGYTHPRRFLASCSDDRTIRIWEVSDLSLAVHDAGGDAANQLRESRETGFGSFDSTADISQSEGCLAFGRGHASRIWSVRFLPRTPKEGPIANLLNILSFGEDATVQRWTVNFDAEGLDVGQLSRDTEIQLNHINTSSLHSGKNIWCSTVITQSESSWILITGGADGKIASNEIPLTENSENSALAITYVFNDFENTKGDLRSQPNLSSQTPRLLHGPQYSVDGLYEYSTISPLRTSHDGADTGGVAPEVFISSRLAFRTYAFIDDRSSFLAIVESGLVVLGSLHPTSSMESSSTSGSLGPRESTQIVWRILRRNDTLKSYPILAGVPPCAMAFLGGTDGTIHCYDHISGSFQPIVTLNRKISGLFAQVIQQPLESRAKDPQSVGLVAALLGFSTAYSWQVRRECDEDGTRVVRIFQSWTLELPPGFIVTSSCFLLSSKILILGARKGTLAVYGLSSDEKTKCTLTPKACFQRVQEGDAVTVILPLPNLHFHNEVMATYILTAGRNGTYSIHGLNLQHDANVHHELRLETIHISTPPFGPNIEGAQFHPTSNELILWGFRGKNFVVWNETNQSETMTVDCGGAHREWTFFYHHDDRGSLIWTKASKLSLNWQRQPSHRVITEGSHGREIKACATSSPIDTGGHSKCRLVVTGAEDTDLRLFAYGEDAKSLVGSRFRWFGAFRKHVTGIQHLQWCGNAGFLFSGGGTEEFFVWRVRFVPGFGIGMVCEAEWPPMGELSDLRVMSFHVLEMNPEQGAIDMQNYFLISVVFSNSTVRIYRYTSTTTTKTFDLLLTGSYTTCCLTQAHCFISSQSIYLATAGTDGFLAFWNLTKGLKKLGISAAGCQIQSLGHAEVIDPDTIDLQTRTRIHQSAVKCMTVVQLSEDNFLIVTGGDDNALAFTRVDFGGALPFGGLVSSTLLIPKAHASAITANTFVGMATSEQQDPPFLRFATSSNDQRLKLWSACIDLNKQGVDGLKIRRDANVYTSVADVSSMGVLPYESRPKILVCGVGMDMWTINQ